ASGRDRSAVRRVRDRAQVRGLRRRAPEGNAADARRSLAFFLPAAFRLFPVVAFGADPLADVAGRRLSGSRNVIGCLARPEAHRLAAQRTFFDLGHGEHGNVIPAPCATTTTSSAFHATPAPMRSNALTGS